MCYLRIRIRTFLLRLAQHRPLVNLKVARENRLDAQEENVSARLSLRVFAVRENYLDICMTL